MSVWMNFLAQMRQQHLDELCEFLRIPSISSLPEHAEAVGEAAQWVANRMRFAGIEGVRVLSTGGHPVVYGEHAHATDCPTVLIYGHFDTQPVDPEDRWEQPPFEPLIRNQRIYARGASDNKGPMLIPILAVEALLKTTGALPVNVKFLFEGQEEIGSPQIPKFLDAHRDMLSCDLVVSADGVQWEEDQPAIYLGFKGICALQIDVRGPDSDLHSGIFGGTVQNPLHALAGLINSMRDPHGRICVEGFYDDVRPLSDQDRQQIAAVPFYEEAYKHRLGVKTLFGEPGYTTLERAWSRPTLEVVGMWGGFQDEGIKAVTPAEAHAKVSCRLVASQQPLDITQAITRHVLRHTPPGVVATVRSLESHALPYSIPTDHPGNQVAHAVLKEVYGKDPYYVRLGGTLPICEMFLDKLSAYTVMFAFGLDDECIHAPNEFFRLQSFERGLRAYGLFLQKLATYPQRKQ
ncbi:MAG: dipeptidase [Planctomycetota bacterium]|nr:dipeptidase [Planctomycetota bacterium]